MIEKAKQLREPALVVGWVIFLVQLIAAWVLFARALGVNTLAEAGVLAGSRNTAFFPTFVVVLLALATLIKPPTKRARGLVLTSGHLLMVSAVTSLVFMIFSFTSGFDFGAFIAAMGGLLDVVVKGLAALSLYWVVDWGRRPAEQPQVTAKAKAAVDVATDRQPVWRADEATGLQWQRAGDAAGGALGTSAAPSTPEAASSAPIGDRSASSSPWPTAGEIAQSGYPASPAEPGEPTGPDWTPKQRD